MREHYRLLRYFTIFLMYISVCVFHFLQAAKVHNKIIVNEWVRINVFFFFVCLKVAAHICLLKIMAKIKSNKYTSITHIQFIIIIWINFIANTYTSIFEKKKWDLLCDLFFYSWFWRFSRLSNGIDFFFF